MDGNNLHRVYLAEENLAFLPPDEPDQPLCFDPFGFNVVTKHPWEDRLLNPGWTTQRTIYVWCGEECKVEVPLYEKDGAWAVDLPDYFEEFWKIGVSGTFAMGERP
mgnify:CR=1 FL=1